MLKIKEKATTDKPMWYTVSVQTSERKAIQTDDTTSYVDGPAYMRFSKNFFSRPSALGFRTAMTAAEGFTIPGIKNGEHYIVCSDNSFQGLGPWFNKGLHIALCLTGLGMVSVGIILFRLPHAYA